MYEIAFPPVTNREDWTQPFEVLDEDTGDAIELSADDIVVQIKDRRSMTTRLTAGISIVDTGVFEASFTEEQLSQICPETHWIGGTVTLEGETVQLFHGTIPILDGVVA